VYGVQADGELSLYQEREICQAVDGCDALRRRPGLGRPLPDQYLLKAAAVAESGIRLGRPRDRVPGLGSA
jgi:hypothetical protein